MENVLLMDTSVASLNKGDEIIMECIKDELKFCTDDKFLLTLPTHVSPFSFYQVFRNSYRVQLYKNCNFKFVCGTNLLVPDMFTHFPQWNVNLLNYKPIAGAVLVGVGKGAGEKSNYYTTMLYKRLLSKKYLHSVRDERTKDYLDNMGIPAINTGCPTMWKLTPEFCSKIPRNKGKEVVFTLTPKGKKEEEDQILINILQKNYDKIYFWVQGIQDLDYFNQFDNREGIVIIPPRLEDYRTILQSETIDYVGTRLHAGIYAMRHGRRTVIIVVDERAREINGRNNLNCIEKRDVQLLEDYINSSIETKIVMPYEEIKRWKMQFI